MNKSASKEQDTATSYQFSFALDLPDNPQLAENIRGLVFHVEKQAGMLGSSYLEYFYQYFHNLLEDLTLNLEEKIKENNETDSINKQHINHYFELLFQHIKKAAEDYAPRQHDLLQEGFNGYINQAAMLTDYPYSRKLKIKTEDKKIIIPNKIIIESYFPKDALRIIYLCFKETEQFTLRFFNELSTIINEYESKIQTEPGKPFDIQHLLLNQLVPQIKKCHTLIDESQDKVKKIIIESHISLFKNCIQDFLHAYMGKYQRSKKQNEKLLPLQLEKIKAIPSVYEYNFDILSERLAHDVILASHRLLLKTKSHYLLQQLKKEVNSPLGILKKLNEEIHIIIARNDADSPEGKHAKDSIKQALQVLSRLSIHLNKFGKYIKSSLPAEVSEELDKKALQLIKYTRIFPSAEEGKFIFNTDKSDQVVTRLLLDVIIQKEYIHPLQKEVNTFVGETEKLITQTEDIVKLLLYTLFQPESEDNQNSQNQLQFFVATQQNKISNIIENTNDLLQKLSNDFQTIEQNIANKYQSNFLNRHIKQYINAVKKEKRKNINIFYPIGKGAELIFQNLSGKVILGKSKGMLFAKKISSAQKNKTTTVNDLLNLLYQITPNSNVLKELPTYYLQLFSRKRDFFFDFFHGRGKELGEAKKTIQRYQCGHKGGILILGEHGSGKSFLSRMITKKFLPDYRSYELQIPNAGTCTLSEFKSILCKTFDKETDEYEHLFNRISNKSVLIIDDLELFWERHSEGQEVIKEIRRLIDTYSDKCLFIINANIFSYRIINNITKIENHFINIIECSPFSSSEIKEIILKRHRTGGLNFVLNNKYESTTHPWDLAKLFDRYFLFSKGNIGFALHAWLVNITHFNGDAIHIKHPKTPDLSPIQNLENEWLVLLIQFIIHKRLNYEKLSRITFMDNETVKSKVNTLVRTGLLINNTSYFQINPPYYHYLKTILLDKQIISE